MPHRCCRCWRRRPGASSSMAGPSASKSATQWSMASRFQRQATAAPHRSHAGDRSHSSTSVSPESAASSAAGSRAGCQPAGYCPADRRRPRGVAAMDAAFTAARIRLASRSLFRRQDTRLAEIRRLSPRIHGTIAHDIGVEIVSGIRKPGDIFGGEIEASDALDVSRTVYREAIRILAAKGLIESRPKAGTRVNPRSRWNLLDPDVLGWTFEGEPDTQFILDLFELRGIIEPAAAALAYGRRSKADMAAMRSALDKGRCMGWPISATAMPINAFTLLSSPPPTMNRWRRWRAASAPRCAGRRSSSSANAPCPATRCPTISWSMRPSSSPMRTRRGRRRGSCCVWRWTIWGWRCGASLRPSGGSGQPPDAPVNDCPAATPASGRCVDRLRRPRG